MIEFKNVSFHYGGEQGTGEGVDNIDLTIGTGEVVVLCGPSGCGKTTLTRLINGLAPHFYPGELEGEVRVDGVCVSTAPLSETSRLVGSVFQNPKSQFFNVDTTGELVFGCENFGLERDEIRRRLDKTVEDMKLDALLGRHADKVDLLEAPCIHGSLQSFRKGLLHHLASQKFKFKVQSST